MNALTLRNKRQNIELMTLSFPGYLCFNDGKAFSQRSEAIMVEFQASAR